jgi:hypothetical protein
LFLPKGAYAGDQKMALVLSPGSIPTTDIYLQKRLAARFEGRVKYVDTLKHAPGEVTLGQGVMVVIVRHAAPPWLRWLKSNRTRLSGVVFLMDDDIPAVHRSPEMPLGYALKTAWRYARSRRLLGEVCSEVWVSTKELANRYAETSPRLMDPEYVASPSCHASPQVYFYHGSWAHRREIAWLVPVVRQVQQIVAGAWFEVMGTDKVKRMFRGIPRVRVVHPMPWPDYLAYAATIRYQVGLAPCFDTDFNRARSHSKLFDITRMGAAGIYSSCAAYAEKIIDGQTGLLCENTEKKWVDAIVMLLNEPALCSRLYTKAAKFVQCQLPS